MPRALSIYLPRWPVWLAQRSLRNLTVNNARREAAWLLWTSDRGTQQVVHCCRLAAAAGVRAGMTLAHGRSLLRGPVEEREYEPQKARAALLRLARWMLRLGPSVAVDEPDGLMLDIAGCERVFGGEGPHVQKIYAALRRFGLTPRMAVAPTYACAWAMARYGSFRPGHSRADEPPVAPTEHRREAIAFVAENQIEESLAPLPVAALRIDERTIESLADVGVERVEHLLALPRDELAARFGHEILRRLDLATGAAAEEIESVRAAQVFEAAHVFDGPVKRIEAIEITARELLQRLVEDLRRRDLGVLHLEVELRRVDVGPVRVEVRLTQASRDHGHLWTLLWPKLERANLGFGVEEISLRAARTGRWRGEQAAFLRDDARAGEPAALGELLDRLIDRLGPLAVTRVRTVETYVPEEAFVHASAGEKAEGRKMKGDPVEVYSAHRPAQLLERPEAIRVMSLVPDGPPMWVEWRGQAGGVVAASGPERIAFPWWTPQLGVTRDYFETEDEFGRRLWIYRDGQSSQWFVHGQWV